MDRGTTCEKVMTVYRLYEEDTHVLLTDRVTFIFIELPKFNKTINELDGNILEGMYFCFKNMTALKERPDVLDHNVFARIFEVSEFYNMDKTIRDKVLYKMTTERDLRNQIAWARKEAIAEGHAEGLAKSCVEIASRMLEVGMDIQQISDLTQLTVEEVLSLKHRE